MNGIQTELKKMGDILIGVARFDERITNLDKRVTSQGRKIDDLSRGEGFVRAIARLSTANIDHPPLKGIT